ncbi:MAG: hypothetical protein HY262_01225 [Chloroflexi bacterium]|nr:hypothetical protein [Chloroflexota bacterium]
MVSLLALGVVGITIASVLTVLHPDYGAARPTPAQLAPFEIQYSIGPDGSLSNLKVGADGAACNTLGKSPVLENACVLALNIDPAFIAGEAFGRLNSEDTSAYEAILWRARLESEPSICDRGGLLEARLEHCRSVAANGPYSRTADGVTVVVSAASHE